MRDLDKTFSMSYAETMKTVLIFSFLFVLSACSSKTPVAPAAAVPATPAFLDIAPNLQVLEIEKGVFVVSHEFPIAQANSLVVDISAQELLIIDAPWTSSATSDLLKWAENKFGARKITAINTHSHLDRIAGNDVFLSQGADVYSSDLTVQYVKKSKPTELKIMASRVSDPELKAEFGKMRIREANHSFPLQEGKILNFGDKKVEIFYPGHGHTKDNVVVYLPEYKVLYGGCFIVGMPKLGYIKEANLKEWPSALEKLSRFEAKWVIPGHGTSYSPDLIEHTKSLVK